MNFIRRLWQRAMSKTELREKLRIIIFQSDTPMGKAFDVALLWSIVLSIIVIVVESMQGVPPIAKQVFTVLEYVFTAFFTLEYLCRLYCSDKPRQYALSFFGIIDLLSTLPLYIGWIFGPARYLLVVRTFRLIRIFRIFKLFSFLQEGNLLMQSIIFSAPKIAVFFLFLVIMVISMGTLMYMVEGNIPGTLFTDIPTSIYWAIVTMTTVGYGDIAPTTPFGRLLSAIVMLMGYTIMAVPTGIVSAQMVHDHKARQKKKSCPECGSPVTNDAHYCSFCGLKQKEEKPSRSDSKLPLILFAVLQCIGISAYAQNQPLNGTIIGTELSVDYSTGQASTTVNTAANAFDGNLSTFFASYERSRTWVGLDLGVPHVITRVGWSPRNDEHGPKRVLLALFEGANRPDFLDAVPLYLIDKEGTIDEISYANVNVSRGFRYVRYIGPSDARCNIAEVAFYGHIGTGNDSCFYQVTNLPTVSFHTLDGVEPYDKEHEIASNFTLIYDNGRKIQEEVGTTRLRGNASMGHPKKPYRIKFDKSSRIFKGSNMRSPAKAKKWTLINNYSDKTLMRNLVAFEIARRMGFNYVPWCKPVDVIVNGEYRGCYQLTDQLTIDKNRIDITEMEPTDTEGETLTGGYLLELDGYASRESSWFTSVAGNPITIKSPDENSITSEQFEYIRREFNLMEGSILSPYFDDPDLGFRSRLDEKSLIQYILTEELAGNPDAFWSCYITKERSDSLFRLGPVWDFDIAFDNDTRFFPINQYDNFLSLSKNGAGNSRALLKRLLSDQVLRDSMIDMWETKRLDGTISSENLISYIDSTRNELKQSQRLNFLRWPILNQIVQVNPRVGGSYEVEVNWLKEFVENRIIWLDNFLSSKSNEEKHTIIEIATAADLADFANRVNKGQTSLSAVLKADIDFSAYPDIMVGSNNYYKGEFDGSGHCIKLNIQRDTDDAGLFRFLAGNVHDLTIVGDIATSAKYAGGIAAHTEGATIERCQSKVNIKSSVNGDGTHGGIVGVSNSGTIIRDCLFNGSIQGKQTNCCAGIVGWASGTTNITRCLVKSNFSVDTHGSDLLARNASNINSSNNYFQGDWGAANDCKDVTTLTEDQVTYGEACFMLERKQPGSTPWRQILGKDVVPTPNASDNIVYSFSHLHCDGTPYSTLGNFTNDPSRNNQDKHTLDEGICKVCNYIDVEQLPRDERGYFLISSASLLNTFAQLVDEGNTGICGVLTKDIDFTAYPTTMIGSSKTFNGVFDGNGHAITIGLQRNADYAGLFGQVSGTIQDLTVQGSITTDHKFAGMVANLLGGKLIRCQSYIDIYATISGDGTHGGLVGLISEGTDLAQLQDCIFAGSINGANVNSCGGLVGWASSYGFFSNCLMAGNINISSEGGDLICRNNGYAILQNTYYLSSWNANSSVYALKTDMLSARNGELCYLLNAGREGDKQAWYQTLNEDPHPVPDKSHLPVWYFEGSYYNESPDAIQSPMAKWHNGKWYDLSGRNIWGKPKQGIYIKDGRKIAITKTQHN